MNNKSKKLKGDAILFFIGTVIFFSIALFLSEASKSTLLTIFIGMALFVGIVFAIGFAYSTVKCFADSVYEQKNK
ncbi:hypothetical protein [Clostridium akagii]|uniref:hypothetical protein n=1 Tax=Clostridium akagii TaxID=91623 RepID=UPI0004790271|nr:hypothetical protein [Clostridium akagii]